MFIAIRTYLGKKKNLKQPNFTPKRTRERTKPKVSRRKEIIKIRGEINEIQTKKETAEEIRSMKVKAVI